MVLSIEFLPCLRSLRSCLSWRDRWIHRHPERKVRFGSKACGKYLQTWAGRLRVLSSRLYRLGRKRTGPRQFCRLWSIVRLLEVCRLWCRSWRRRCTPGSRAFRRPWFVCWRQTKLLVRGCQKLKWLYLIVERIGRDESSALVEGTILNQLGDIPSSLTVADRGTGGELGQSEDSEKFHLVFRSWSAGI